MSVTGDGFKMTFDAQTGAMTSWSADGEEILKSGPKLNLWRAYTDNDKAPIEKGLYKKIWRNAVAGEKDRKATFEEIDGTVRVTISSTLPTVRSAYKMAYTICGDGEVQVDVGMDIAAPAKMKHPHRIGTELIVPGSFQNIKWFGRGPVATYSDRNYERIGLFSGTVDEQWVDYSRPQENGNKVGVRWMSLTNDDGNGLLVTALGSELSVGAKYYSQETIEASAYSFEMNRSEDIFLNIDHRQLGVGGNNSWGKTALNRYQLKKNNLVSATEFDR